MEKVHPALTHCSALAKDAVPTEDSLLLLQYKGHMVLRVTWGVQDTQRGTWTRGRENEGGVGEGEGTNF